MLHKFKSIRLPGWKNRFFASLAPTKLPSEVDVVVVGGGSLGCSTLYHLTKLGVRNCILLERDKITSGTTWHTAGLLWRRKASDIDHHLIEHTLQLNTNILERETGVSTNFIQNGALFVASKKERLNEYKRMLSLSKYFGAEAHLISPKEMEKIHPLLRVDDLKCAFYSPDVGVIDPTGYCAALLRGAELGGAQVFEKCPVIGVELDQNPTGYSTRPMVKGVVTPHGIIKTRVIVNCAGVWAPKFGQLAGVSVPLLALKHAYVMTEGIDGLKGLPNVRDQDNSIYFRVQGNAMGIGGYEPNPLFWDDVKEDFSFSLFQLSWDVFEQHLNAAIHRMPCLEKVGIRSEVCGPEAFTPDHRPLMGEVPEVRGYFLGCGFNSGGMMSSGGCGQQLAHWIVHGRPEWYMYNFDIRRFSTRYSSDQRWIKERSHEAYANNHSIGWPNDESLASRNMRKDPLHEELLNRGCVYQERLGMERPGWFATDGKTSPVLEYDYYGQYGHKQHDPYPYYDRLRLDYSFDQFPGTEKHISAECMACRNSAAIFNMTAFSKFCITGPDAKKAADWIFTANMRKPIGSTIYTCILNKAGGIESDLTVSVVESNGVGPLKPPGSGKAEQAFYITASGATAQHVREHILTEIENMKFNAQLTEVSDQLSLLSVQGRHSREILQPLMDCDLSDQSFPFSTNRLADCNGHPCRILRLSFVGELGFELHVPYESTLAVYKAIMESGKRYDIKNSGFRAIYSLSAEKGYRLWGSDVRPTDTPLEALLGFTCKLKSDIDFVGKKALEKQKAEGLKKKWACFTLDEHFPLWGLEVIHRNRQPVGYLRRAEFAHTLQKPIAYGYISMPNNGIVTDDWLQKGNYEIECLQGKKAATFHAKHPFDPENKRLKGIYEDQERNKADADSAIFKFYL